MSKGNNAATRKLKVTFVTETRFYFRLKLRTLEFLTLFMDTNQWAINFISDLESNPQRYIKVREVKVWHATPERSNE